MTELEEVAQAIHEKRVDKGNLTFAEARALAYIELPKDESQNVIDGVAEALMAYNTPE